MKKAPFVLCLSLLILAACSKGSITIRGGAIGGGGNTPTSSLAIGSKTGIKLSNGGGRAAGSDLSAKFEIQANDRRVAGPRLSGRFSISKTRVR